jgi:peptide methionine sulfoxide reductase MsrA
MAVTHVRAERREGSPQPSMVNDEENQRTPHGGRALSEAYFATGATAFLEQALTQRTGAHAAVTVGVFHRRKRGNRGTRRRLGESPTSPMGGAHGNGDGAREVVRVRWDQENPYAATFGELLDVFWDSHDPTHAPIDDLHANIVFVTSDSQYEQAVRSIEKKTDMYCDADVLTRMESAIDYSFTEAPERFQRRLLRASEDEGSRDGSTKNGNASARSSMDERAKDSSPNGSASEAHTEEPAGSRTLLGSVNATLHWAVDWTTVMAVHVAAYLIRGGAENERKAPR